MDPFVILDLPIVESEDVEETRQLIIKDVPELQLDNVDSKKTAVEEPETWLVIFGMLSAFLSQTLL